MPVPLEELMRELPPERRAEVERNASALAADYRQRMGEIDASHAVSARSARVSVGTKANTGQRCPQSGVWKVENAPSASMPITVDNVMPPYANRAVTWVLVQYA